MATGSVDATTPNRTQRRRLATHRDLLDATIDELLGPQAGRITAASIADRADRAAGTFFNHFDSVEAAIEQALRPITDLRDGARDFLETAENPREAIALVLGSLVGTIASANRELRAVAAARRLGYELPGTGPLAEAFVTALGGARSPNHVPYATQLSAAVIDTSVRTYAELEHEPTLADLELTAWTLMCSAAVPNEDTEALVDEAVAIAAGQLDISDREQPPR